ncbi:MAG: hypothetical protein ACP5NW_00635 [Candidatus Woesearchaeota archaeon]
MRAKKNPKTFGDKLLKEEDNARPNSLKRQYIVAIRENYLASKVLSYILATIIVCLVLMLLTLKYITVMTNNNFRIIMALITICVVVVIIIVSTWMMRKREIEMDDSIRAEFDSSYGVGAYGKVMKKIGKKYNSK